MHREGHIGAGLAVYAPLGFILIVAGFQSAAIVGAVITVALAMLPDQDQRVPLIKHRGITHTVWFALLVGIVFAVVGLAFGLSQATPIVAVGLAVFGLVLGVVIIGSHILADALTPMGVQPFAPVRSRSYSYEVAKASNPIANYALLVLGGGLALAALWLGTTITG